MKNADDGWRSHWLKQRLDLVHHHPDLKKLEAAVWKFCVGFIENPNHGKRLVIYGNNGAGKSRTVKAVHRWVKDRAMDMPLVLRGHNASTVWCETVNWSERVSEFKEGSWDIDDYIDCPLLILDDLGAEHDPSKCGVDKLYQLLERRERRWTIITTNIDPSSWEKRFDRRISDRMLRHSQIVDLSKVPSYSVNT
jgi:DNA replication protein DnaC